jgi:serine/threonine-protein kinase
MPEWIGQTIGNVRIEKFLARGGMAEVYLGTHITLARPVAVKVLHGFREEEYIPLERFEREAKVAATMRHPNIVQIHDFGHIDGHPYIVMEYFKGPTLATYLQHQRKQRIPQRQVAHLLKELAAAVDYAHARGVIHRDIKPANILLHNKTDEIPLNKVLPEDVEAVLTDFGLVRLVDTDTHTTSDMISGTPAYMSPEQARGDKKLDHRSDIYSLGIVLYELLAGRVPFKADHLAVLQMQTHATPRPIPGIQLSVQKVLDRALAKKPEDRYESARALAADYMDAVGMVAEANALWMSIPSSRVMAPVETPPSLNAAPQRNSSTLSRSQPTTSARVRLVALIGIGLIVVGFGAWAISQFSASIQPTAVPTQISQPTDGSTQVHATRQSPTETVAIHPTNTPAGATSTYTLEFDTLPSPTNPSLIVNSVRASQTLVKPTLVPPTQPPTARPEPTNTPDTPTPPPPRPSDPRIEVAPGSGRPGDTFTIVMNDFPRNQNIQLVIIFADSGVPVLSVPLTPNAEGDATLLYESPQNAQPGNYNIYARSVSNDTTVLKIGEFLITSP